jgi:hypothetical protein
MTMIVTDFAKNRWKHVLNVFRMLYSIIIIFIAYLFFTSGSKKFIMEPVELLTKFLNRMIRNPLDVDLNKLYTNFVFADRAFIEAEYINKVHPDKKSSKKLKISANQVMDKSSLKTFFTDREGFLNSLGLTPSLNLED